jgi:hypothetical protein
VTEFTKVVPLDVALAAVDSPESVAQIKKEAAERAKKVEGRDRAMLFRHASVADMNEIFDCFRTDYVGTPVLGVRGHRTGGYFDQAKAEAEAGRVADKVIHKVIEIQLRAEAIQRVYQDPDRAENERIWQRYVTQIRSRALQQGRTEGEWIAKWKDLLAERNDAEQFGNEAELRSADARLERHSRVAYPVLPGAAWEAADALSEVERPDEYLRLEHKYGPRHAATNGKATTTTNGRRSGRLKLAAAG